MSNRVFYGGMTFCAFGVLYLIVHVVVAFVR